MLDDQRVAFIGEINDNAGGKFLRQAAGLLFPIDWPEPFGLVMIEAMACGTPVLAFRCGSVPEIIEDGLTGRIVYDVGEAVRAMPELLELDRTAIRARFEERFSAPRMASDYLRIYETMLRRRSDPQRHISAMAAHAAAANSADAPPATARTDN